MTNQNHKVATVVFKFEHQLIYWNESRKSIRDKIGLIHIETENPFIDEYDEVIFGENSESYLLYVEYGNEEKLKKLYLPVGFKIIYQTVCLHYSENMENVKSKLSSVNIFWETLSEYYLIFEELNLVTGTAANGIMFEFMFLYRNFKDIRNHVDMSFSNVKIINFQPNIID